jgi:hypothetical protein
LIVFNQQRVVRPSDRHHLAADIRRCCEFLIGIADAATGSSYPDHELLAKEREALGLALFSLDYFVDRPWMVLTTQGSSMRVVHNAELARWEEVHVVAPAEASWLTLTPSGGTPSWES